MTIWLFFALLSAFGHSIWHVTAKRASASFPKAAIVWWSSSLAAILLFTLAFIHGIPNVSSEFWTAALATAVINAITFPLLLKAYQWGDFSSVFPMLLLTPLFMVGTSYLILGESPTVAGFFGMIITVAGLFLVAREPSFGMKRRGVLLGVFVAFLYSISASFDKRVALNSDIFFGPAVVTGLMSLGTLPWFIRSSRSIPLRTVLVGLPSLLGLLFVADLLTFYTALPLAIASYTILVKRTSIIFGLLWSFLFFKETNLLPKLLGVLIALAGLGITIFLGGF